MAGDQFEPDAALWPLMGGPERQRLIGPAEFRQLYQQDPAPPSDADIWAAIQRGRARPACACARETIRKALVDHLPCGRGGCPYGGDF